MTETGFWDSRVTDLFVTFNLFHISAEVVAVFSLGKVYRRRLLILFNTTSYAGKIGVAEAAVLKLKMLS